MATLIATLASFASAGELQWRRGLAPATKQSTVDQGFSQPTFSEHRDDSDARSAAFEDNDSQIESGAEVRSVVVERSESYDSLRSAQLPAPPSSTDTSGQPGSTAADSQFEEELRSPFIDTPELPTMDPAPPEGFEDTTQQPQEIEQPQTEQIQQQPEDITPPTEFQPNVPPAAAAQEIPDAVPTPPEDTLEAEREKAEEACSDGFANLKAKTVDKLSLIISVTGEEGSDYPFECSIDDGTWHEGRCWDQTTYMWKASALCHKPLFFEDEQLERYGHSFTPCFQPIISGAHFFTRLPILPYCMGVEPPTECIYALGHYRPGNCAPYMCNPVPISARGALFQAGAVVGAAAAIP